MTLKYASKIKVFAYFIFAIIRSLQAVFIAFIIKELMNLVNHQPSLDLKQIVILAVVGMIGFIVIGLIYAYLKSEIVFEVNTNIKRIANRYLMKQKHLPENFRLSFMTNDLKQIETNRVEAELEVIFNALQFVAVLVAAFTNSVLLTIVFLLASLFPMIAQAPFGKLIMDSSEKWEEKNNTYTNKVKEAIEGRKISLLYDAAKTVEAKLNFASKQMEAALKKMNIATGSAMEFTTVIAFLFGMILPFSFGVYLVLQGHITLGTFMMIAQLANNFINPIVASFEYINDIKSTEPMWKKFLQAKAVFEELDEQDASESKKERFANLSLIDAKYSVADKTIFENLNLDIKAGEKVLLMAPSGWGKTTILNVLLGKIALSSGSYQLNGLDADHNWQHNHEYFAYVNQKPFIYTDTLLFNLTLGKDFSNEELTKVITQAGLADFVAEKGLDYVLDPEKNNLSGGQIQRIEIARALLMNRDVLLADEATSALDESLSQDIHKAIFDNYEGTIIEIAHKISDVEKAMFDKVINLAK